MTGPGRWAEAPIDSAVRATGDPPHRVRSTGTAIEALDHGDADRVLAALGGRMCPCNVIVDQWTALGADPLLLPYLVDEFPAAAAMLSGEQDASDPTAAVRQLSLSLRLPPDQRETLQRRYRESSARTELVRHLVGLDFAFRTALAREIARGLPDQWAAICADRFLRTAVTHAAWIVLRQGLDTLRDARVSLELASGSRVRADRTGKVTVTIGPVWFRDVAAEGRLAEWWMAMWE